MRHLDSRIFVEIGSQRLPSYQCHSPSEKIDRAKNGFSGAATVDMDIFSGYELRTVSGVYATPSIGQGWKLDSTGEEGSSRIHLKNVTSECGTCFISKYRQTTPVENVSPARVRISAPSASPSSNRPSTQFYFHANRFKSSKATLLEGVDDRSWRQWNPLPGKNNNSSLCRYLSTYP